MTKRANLALRNGIVRLVQMVSCGLIAVEFARYGMHGLTIPLLLLVILKGEEIDRKTRQIRACGNREEDREIETTQLVRRLQRHGNSDN